MKEFRLDEIANHTVKKIELIAKYTEDWAYKLLGYPEGDGIIFIDCMCNSGRYKIKGTSQLIDGTAFRVLKSLCIAAKKYPNKKVDIYFNDINCDKIDYLKRLTLDLVNDAPNNVNIHFSNQDASIFLKDFTKRSLYNKNTLLIYDPYRANIDWTALQLFLNTWGEVIINHMVSDIVRGRSQANKQETIERYEMTYRTTFDKLTNLSEEQYEQIILNIIKDNIKLKKQTYITSFPFYISTNSHIYNLIFITFNKTGFNLFKKTAWKTAGGQSSIKTKKESEQTQLLFDIEYVDDKKYTYNINDIAIYVIRKYKDRKIVPLDEIYNDLENHLIFPCEGFKNQILRSLKDYGCETSRDMLYFSKVI